MYKVQTQYGDNCTRSVLLCFSFKANSYFHAARSTQSAARIPHPAIRSTHSAARSTHSASRSTQHGYFNSYFHGSMNTTMRRLRIASYLIYCLQCESAWKLEKFQLSCGLRAADCVLRTACCGLRAADCGLRSAECGLRSADCGLRACMNRTMGIHSVNFSCVLRTACCVEVWIGLLL